MDEVQLETIRPDASTLEIQCVFEAGPESEGEYVLECEAGGSQISVGYQFGSIRLTREIMP